MVEHIDHLIFSAHVDDAELGMGGTMAKMIEQDNDIQIVAFSSADKSLPEGYSKGSLIQEAIAAAAALGAPVPMILGYETRQFPRDRQDILEDLIKIRDEFNPGVVWCPSDNDRHQDHRVLSEEVQRAFHYKPIFMYQMVWNQRVIYMDHFEVLTNQHLLTKTKALKQFKSQKIKPYMRPNNIVAQSINWGLAINQPYAEVFQVVKSIND